MEKMAWEETNKELDINVKILEAEERIRRANHKLDSLNEAVKRKEMENAKIRDDTAAYKLYTSEMERELKAIVKRGKGYEKKIADVEKQTRVLRSQLEEVQKRVMELAQELLVREKEVEEAEMEWKQEVKAKEKMVALVAQEIKMAKTQKARSRAYLSELRQQVATEIQLAEDERRRLEDEYRSLEDKVSRLRMSCPVEDLLPENLDFLYSYDEEAASSKLKSHWFCMMCMQNRVSVVFLPCTHQVVCFSCYEKNVKSVGACCPYCLIGIEQAFKVYGPSS